MFPTSLLSLALLSGLTAHVDDPLSHGAVGDARLSLDEAIRVANGTLSMAALSNAERSHFSGTGMAVERIEVDAARTPVIRLEAPLTTVMGSHHGTMLHIDGIAANGVRPRLDGGNHATVLSVATNMVTVSGFEIDGGQVAVEATSMMGGMMHMPSTFRDLDVHDQSDAGFHCHATGAVTASVYVADSVLHSMPLGFRFVDNTQNGELMVEGERLAFDGVKLGTDHVINSSGNQSMSMWWRCTFENGATFMKVRRDPSSQQRFMVRIVHGEYRSTDHLLDISGNVESETMVHHHAALLSVPPGKNTLWCHPDTARFDIHGSENVFEGNVVILCNRLTRRVWQHNNVYRNARVVFDADGVPPDLLWNRYENSTIEVLAGSRTPFTIQSCELYETDVTSAAFLGAPSLDNCFVVGGTMQGSVSVQNPAPSPWLGETTATDKTPAIGETTTLISWLPPGMALVWDIGIGDPRPLTTDFPFRFYMLKSTLTPISGPVSWGLRTLPVTLPKDPALAGVEFFFQAVAVPIAGQTHVPVISLPAGVRVVPHL